MKPLKTQAFILLGLSSIGLGISPSAIANDSTVRPIQEVEAPETVTGSSEDLRGLEADNWQWEEVDKLENTYYSIEKETFPETYIPDSRQEGETWENNTGDPANPATGIPLTTF